MYRALIVFLLVINSAWATDYIGRLAADESTQKGGDSSLDGSDALVSPSTEPLPGDASAPGVIVPDSEASEDRSPSPDDPALSPASFVHELEMVGVCKGSCVYLGDGLFLTAKHVINYAPAGTIIKIDGKQYGGRRKWQGPYDVGYLQMQGIPADWPAAKIALPDLMAESTPLTLSGVRTGEHPSLSDTEKKSQNGSVFLNLQDSSSVDGGDSGGGAFDAQGNLVGIIVEKVIDTRKTPSTTDDLNLPIAVIVPITACLEHLPITHLLPESESVPAPPEESADMPQFEYLLFSAVWCGPCRTVKATVKPQVEAAGITVTVVDTDQEPKQATKYNISSLPTWVLLKDGVEVWRETYGSAKSLLSHAK